MKSKHTLSTLSSTSGQALLLAIFLVILLVLTIPAMVSFGSYLSRARMSSLQRTNGMNAIQSGLSQAEWLLAQSTDTWNHAMQNPTATFSNLGLDGSTVFVWDRHNQFTLHASTGLPALPYQIRVTVFSVDSNNQPLIAETAFLSPKTMSLSVPNALSATPALTYFGSAPLQFVQTGMNHLIVDWGPVADFSSPLQLNLLNPVPYPRMFGVNSIFPYSTNPGITLTTDDRKYWAYSSLGDCPAVLDSSYIALANASTVPDLQSEIPGSGYIDLSSPIISSPSYTVSNPGAVIYLHGPQVNGVYTSTATLQRAGIDVKAFIVEGNLELNKPTGSAGDGLLDNNNITVAVPPAVLSEYPTNPSYPANTVITGGTCTPGQPDCPLTSIVNSPSMTDVQGFVYVKGNLILTSGRWLFVGGLRVDGQIIWNGQAASDGIHIVKDDLIMNNVLVDRMAIKVDQSIRIPVGGGNFLVRPKNVAAPYTITTSDWVVPTKVVKVL